MERGLSESLKRCHQPAQAVLEDVAGCVFCGVSVGLCLILGLFTRPVAFVLCGEMAFAYFIEHAPRNFIPLLNGGENAIMFCFACLYLACAGGGPISVDALMRKKG